MREISCRELVWQSHKKWDSSTKRMNKKRDKECAVDHRRLNSEIFRQKRGWDSKTRALQIAKSKYNWN